MIYLDNAATSYPKPDKVYDEMDRCLREYCANPGRGGHEMSIISGKAVMEAREIISRLFGIDNPLQLCFTKNATEALNLGIKGVLKPGDHVITTCMEHNSVIRALKALEKDMGIEVTIIRGNEYGEIDPQDVAKGIKGNSKLIICTLSSNVNGIIMPVKEIGYLSREKELIFLIDASQGAGTLELDVKDMNADMLAFPGHKGLMGPQGTGALYVREGIEIKPLMQGGTGSNSESAFQPDFMPDMMESGTLNTPGIIGLKCGVEFINSMGLENIRIYKHMLVERLHSGIASIKGARLYNKRGIDENSGIVAMNFNGLESTRVSQILDREYDIATRAGLHCAPLAHQTLGTLKEGVVRFSVSCFNSIDDIDNAVNALREISGKYAID